MRVSQILSLAGAVVAPPAAAGPVFGQSVDMPLVRIAELEIDPVHLEAYKALLAEEQEVSVRNEPGVLMLHSVALADQPTHIRLLEVYADQQAYEAHLQSPHFLKYKTGTASMVKSLILRETVPIRLCSKGIQSSDAVCIDAKNGD